MPDIDSARHEKDNSTGIYCPLIKDPHPDCYCLDLNNSKINLAIRFCTKNYEQCDIYNRVVQNRSI